jgi:hypothetical protein
MSIIIGLLTFASFCYSRDAVYMAQISRETGNLKRWIKHDDRAFFLFWVGGFGLAVLTVMAK